MSDNGMWDRAEGCVPPASLCTLSVGPLYCGQSECHAFPKHSPTPLGQAVWSSHYQSNMSNHQCFPPHVQQENLASIIIAPQGELPKFLPSSFVRNEALSFPAICWNMSFDIKSHRFPLAAWPRQMFIIFIYVTEDDPAARRCRGLAADAHVMLIMSKSLLNKLTLGDNLESIWGNCGFL